MPYRFTGKEFDEETKLYYFGARYYDPRTSVWQSPDPALENYLSTGKAKQSLPSLATDWRSPLKGAGLGGIFNPRNLNSFGYGHQRPLNITDPNGKWGEVTAAGCAVTAEVGCAPGAIAGAIVDTVIAVGVVIAGYFISDAIVNSDEVSSNDESKAKSRPDSIAEARTGNDGQQIFYHGTDLQSGLDFVRGKGLDARVANRLLKNSWADICRRI